MVQDKDQLLYIEQYFGSIDRFMAYIIEEYKGRFPLWLSPTQVKILPISDEQLEYAKTIEKELLKNKIRVKVDSRSEKIGYKIREAELERVPYMLILGKKEVEEKARLKREQERILKNMEYNEKHDKLREKERIQEDISTKATQLIHLPRVQSPFCTLGKPPLDSTKT